MRIFSYLELFFSLCLSLASFGNVTVQGEKNGWQLDDIDSFSALRTPVLTDGETSTISFLVKGESVSWQIKTSTEGYFDKLIICIDPDTSGAVYEFSGENDWQEFSYYWGDYGDHTVTLTYSKDGSGSNGDDCCWVWFDGVEASFNGESGSIPKSWAFSDNREWEYESSLTWYESWNSGITLDYSTYKGYRNPTIGYFKSPALSDGEEAWVSYEVEGVLGLGFDFCLESEKDSDFLIVYVDDVEQMRLSGSHWGESKMLPFSDDGKHTVKWVYRRDSNGNKAQFYDCVYIHFDGIEDIFKSHFKNDKDKPWVKATSDDGAECLKASGLQNGGETTFELEVTTEGTFGALGWMLKDSENGVGSAISGSLNIYVNGAQVIETSMIGDYWDYLDNYGFSLNPGDKIKFVFKVDEYASNPEEVCCFIQIPCMDDYFSVYKEVSDDETAQVQEQFLLNLNTGRDVQRGILDGDDGVSFASGEYPAWVYDENEGAMRSASVKSGGESWMSAAVVGKGTFSFRWKSSGETLSCYVDGELKETLYGAADWAQVDVALENDARHEIKWVFKRGEESSDASAAGWVDGVVWNAPEGWDDPDELILPHSVSAFFNLDTSPSPRKLDTTNFCEKITYNPAWANAASVVLTVDASEIVKTSESGTFEWKSEKEGLFSMKLEFLDSAGAAIGEPLTASFKIELDPLPLLGEGATAADVAALLNGVADLKLKANVTDFVSYTNFHAWVERIGADHRAVANSLYSWLSYALDAAGLIPSEPKEGDLTIDSFTPVGNGTFALEVALKDIPVGANASAVNLEKVFGVEGAEKLMSGGVGFSSDNVEVNAAAPENGNVKFTVTPKVGNGEQGTGNGEKPSSFFLRVKMK